MNARGRPGPSAQEKTVSGWPETVWSIISALAERRKVLFEFRAQVLVLLRQFQ